MNPKLKQIGHQLNFKPFKKLKIPGHFQYIFLIMGSFHDFPGCGHHVVILDLEIQ